MQTPSSRYLSRQPTILKGLNLNELCFVVVLGIVGGALTGVIFGLLLGFIAVFAICGILTGGFVGYFVLSGILVRLKGSAPNMLLQKKAIIALAKFGLLKNPYSHYQGVWLKARKLKR